MNTLGVGLNNLRTNPRSVSFFSPTADCLFRTINGTNAKTGVDCHDVIDYLRNFQLDSRHHAIFDVPTAVFRELDAISLLATIAAWPSRGYPRIALAAISVVAATGTDHGR